MFSVDLGNSIFRDTIPWNRFKLCPVLDLIIDIQELKGRKMKKPAPMRSI